MLKISQQEQRGEAFLCVLTAPYHLLSLHPSRKTSRAIQPTVLFLWDPISRGSTTSVQPRFPVELTPTTHCNIPLMKTQTMDLLGLPPYSPLVTKFLPHKALKEAVFRGWPKGCVRIQVWPRPGPSLKV